jgi:hypothetical protein
MSVLNGQEADRLRVEGEGRNVLKGPGGAVLRASGASVLKAEAQPERARRPKGGASALHRHARAEEIVFRHRGRFAGRLAVIVRRVLVGVDDGAAAVNQDAGVSGVE